MFTAQIVLLAATAVAPLASNAAPILSGMFFHSKRAENNVQLAQGTNFFFNNLHLEAQCTPGQIACVSQNLATCSGEANWEITPCGANTSCFAIPNADNTNIDVQCLAQADADAAIAQAGGQGGVAVDFQVTEAPFPDPNAGSTPTEGAPTDATATPTESEGGAAEPTETCPPEDGSEEGSDGSEEGDGSDGTIVDEPTITDLPAEPTPTPTDGESCNTDEPEETETITLILVPNPTQPGSYETVTFSGQLPEATSTETASLGLGPGAAITDIPSEGAATDAPTDATATPTDAAAPTETCTESEGGEGEGEGEYTDAPAESAAPTTFTADAPAASPTSPTTSSGVVNVVGTHVIPAVPVKRSTIKRSNNPFRFVKVRRSSA